VDQTHRPSALARENKWVVIAFLWTPTKAAVYLLSLTKQLLKCFLPKVVCSFDCLCFFKLLGIQLFGGQVHLLTPEIFNPKPHSAQLNCVELLNFVVELPLRIFQTAHYQPKTIDRFFVEGIVSVVNIEPLYILSYKDLHES